MTVDVAMKVAGNRYEIGLVKNQETGKYDMLADWWGIRKNIPTQSRNQGIETDSDLQDALLRHTTKHTIMEKYRRQGFRAEVSEDEKNNIHLKLTRA